MSKSIAWTVSQDAAREICKFFSKNPPRIRVLHVGKDDLYNIYEIRMGRCLLELTVALQALEKRKFDTIGIQLLNRKSYIDMGGVILTDCERIDFITEENGHKYVMIYAKNGEAGIDARSVHVTIYPKVAN